MNPWGLSAEGLVIFGLVLHLIGDFGLQSDWMANYKANRGTLRIGQKWHESVFLRHPAAYVHAGIHGLLLAVIFGWAAIPLAIAHLIIDCRWIVVKWSRLMKQTPANIFVMRSNTGTDAHLMDVGSNVRLWLDQTFHIVCLAIAAILVTL